MKKLLRSSLVAVTSLALTASTLFAGSFTANADSPKTQTTTVQKASHTPSTKLSYDLRVFVKSLVGTKYKWGGTSPKTGFDTSGFVKYVIDKHDILEKKGIKTPRTTEQFRKLGHPVKQYSPMEPGDIAFFKGYTGDKKGTLIGVSLGLGYFGIVTKSKGVQMININNPKSFWRKQFVSGRTFMYYKNKKAASFCDKVSTKYGDCKKILYKDTKSKIVIAETNLGVVPILTNDSGTEVKKYILPMHDFVEFKEERGDRGPISWAVSNNFQTNLSMLSGFAESKAKSIVINSEGDIKAKMIKVRDDLSFWYITVKGKVEMPLKVTVYDANGKVIENDNE